MTHSRDKDKGKGKEKEKAKKKTVHQEETFSADPFGENLVRQNLEIEKRGKKKSKGFNFGAFGQPGVKRNAALERKKQEQRAKKETTKKAAEKAKAVRLAEEKQRQEFETAKAHSKTSMVARFSFRENFPPKKPTPTDPDVAKAVQARREETAKNKFFGKHKTNSKPVTPSSLNPNKPKKPSQA